MSAAPITPPPLTDWRAVARALRAPGLAALAAIAVALVTCARELPALVSALLLPRSVAAEATEKSAERTEQYNASFEGYLAQIHGRSIFYVPGAPRKARPEEKPKDDKPAAPTTYGGPKILAMVNDKVWFDDSSSLVSGGEGRGDLKVLGINGPWSAKIAWRGVEFDVPLFDRTTDRFLDRPKPTTPAAEPAPAVPAPAPGEPAKSEEARDAPDGASAPAPAEAPAPGDAPRDKPEPAPSSPAPTEPTAPKD